MLRAEHINPFIIATVNTFAAMVHAEAKPGKISLATPQGARADVSGIIGLSGGARGSVLHGCAKCSRV